MCDPAPRHTASIFVADPEWRRRQAARTAARIPELRLKAEAGDADPQHELGWAYMSSDIGEAAKWLEAAAEGGRVEAMTLVSSLYEYGRGVPSDTAKAHRWARISLRVLAADANDDRAAMQATLAGLASRLAPDHRASAEREAADWKPRAR